MTSVFGLAVALAVLAAGEWALREWPQPDGPYQPPRFGASTLPTRTRSNTHIAIHLPPKSPHPFPLRIHEIPSHPPAYPPQYFQRDSWTGIRMANGFAGYVQENSLRGEVNYRVFYQMDGTGRRFTEGQDDLSRTRNLLLLGCSYTVGEGVGQAETMAARVAQMQKDVRAYNYGVHGWGPGNLLRWVRSGHFASGITAAQKTKIVYFFVDHHLNRLTGSLDVYRAGFNWQRNLPYYYLDEEGRLQTNAMLDGSGRPWTDWVYQWLAASELLKYFSVEMPPRFTDQHFKLFAAVVEDLQRGLKELLPQSEFYVAFFPGNAAPQVLIPYLDQAGIATLDYSGIRLEDYMEASPYLPDRHPSAAAYSFLARQILTDLDWMN